MRHRERRHPWEIAVEVIAAAMLLIPTSLILFFVDVVWRDRFWAGTALLGTLTVPPLLALWWIERRRQHRWRATSTEPPSTKGRRSA
jgi:hypothetical protein